MAALVLVAGMLVVMAAVAIDWLDSIMIVRGCTDMSVMMTVLGVVVILFVEVSHDFNVHMHVALFCIKV